MGVNYPVALGVLVAALALLLASSAALPSFLRMAGSSDKLPEEQPEDFRYYQIYASENGTTHFTLCRMHGFDLKAYSSKPQFTRSDFGGDVSKLVFTELAVGLEQELQVSWTKRKRSCGHQGTATLPNNGAEVGNAEVLPP
jgi:hypothetical protein